MEGKAKEALSKFQDSKDDLDRMINNNKMLLNSLAIEWLDSESIYISISTLGLQSWFKYEIQAFYPLTRMESFAMYRTRQEATEAAIKKAVEIYNSRC